MTVRCLVLQLEVTRKLLRIWWIAFAMRETQLGFYDVRGAYRAQKRSLLCPSAVSLAFRKSYLEVGGM